MSRLFTQTQQTSYNEYNDSLKHKHILKNILTKKVSQSNDMILRNNLVFNFSSYERFIGITKTYFENFITKISVKSPISLADAQTSYVENTQPVITGLFPYAKFTKTEKQLVFPTKINFNQVSLDVNLPDPDIVNPDPDIVNPQPPYGCQDCSLDYY